MYYTATVQLHQFTIGPAAVLIHIIIYFYFIRLLFWVHFYCIISFVSDKNHRKSSSTELHLICECGTANMLFD